VEAARQYVEEEAADEFVGRERHGLELVAAFDPIVLPFEGDASLVERDEPGLRDRDTVGVARRGRPSARRTASWRKPPIPSGAKAKSMPSAACGASRSGVSGFSRERWDFL
jgi:hypothetical protein